MFALPHGVSLALKVITKEIELLRKKNLTIALDGHSSSGKSTLAKDISKILGIVHIDSGAMYRAVTLHFLNMNIDLKSESEISAGLKEINIEFRKEGADVQTFLNGNSVSEEIRAMKVSDKVSDVAAISLVRRFCVAEQRKLAQNTGVVMDGRDIGTVVFPKADAKLFITASLEVRSERRFKELVNRGVDIALEEVRNNLEKRDHIDSNRVDSPLKQADDATVIDTSHMDRGAMLAAAIKIIHHRV